MLCCGVLLCSLPGDYGFDPLGLGKSASNLERFAEAELLHARWSMLAVAGVVAVELEPNVSEVWCRPRRHKV